MHANDTLENSGKQVISDSNVPPEDIVAVGCDSQGSVVVAVDEHADPLMRAIHWMDTRGGPYNCKITAGFPSIQGYGIFKLLKWIKLTGLVPTRSGMDSLGHVFFIKNDEIPNLVKFKQIFEPDEANRETYDRMYTQYRELFKKNKRIFKELNKQI